MSREDQVRLEDYLELERYLAELQAGHVTQPPSELARGHADIYRILMLFRTASTEGAEPRTEFAVALQIRLEQELQKQSKIRLILFCARILIVQRHNSDHNSIVSARDSDK